MIEIDEPTKKLIEELLIENDLPSCHVKELSRTNDKEILFKIYLQRKASIEWTKYMNDGGNIPATDEQMIEIQNKLMKEIQKDLIKLRSRF